MAPQASLSQPYLGINIPARDFQCAFIFILVLIMYTNGRNPINKCSDTQNNEFMAKLDILQYPNPRLRIKASPVKEVNDSIRCLVDDMLETMISSEGIGLAASQVDVHQRVIVMDLTEDRSQPKVFINPEIEVLDESTEPYDEGCLSVPGFYETVDRPIHVMISALDRDGNAFKEEASGLLALCIQHEIDHLEGKLFVDYLSPLKRQMIRKKKKKQLA